MDAIRDALAAGQSAGPLVIVGLVALFLAYRVIGERRSRPTDTLKAYQDIIEAYHEATLENTRVMERLAVLIEERTRRNRNV